MRSSQLSALCNASLDFMSTFFSSSCSILGAISLDATSSLLYKPPCDATKPCIILRGGEKDFELDSLYRALDKVLKGSRVYGLGFRETLKPYKPVYTLDFAAT